MQSHYDLKHENKKHSFRDIDHKDVKVRQNAVKSVKKCKNQAKCCKLCRKDVKIGQNAAKLLSTASVGNEWPLVKISET